jgi:predicted metalloprotease
MKFNVLISTLSAAFLTLSSGSAWSQEQNSVDCSTAKEDIAHLQHEKRVLMNAW